MRTVLIAEDEGATLRAIRLILRKHGFNVLMAANGAEALELINKFEGEPGMQVDLLMTDLQMPRMGGLELLGELDKMPRAIPALVITAFNDRQNVLKAFRNRKCYDFLDKPLDEEKILCAINSVIRKQEAEAEQVRQAAQEIAKSGGDGLKNEILSVIAHELNTPMSGIIGGVELIKEGQLDDEQRAFADAVGISQKN